MPQIDVILTLNEAHAGLSGTVASVLTQSLRDLRLIVAVSPAVEGVRGAIDTDDPRVEIHVLNGRSAAALRNKATGELKLPPSYGLLGKKLNYGVDYGNYMHQLAAEIGASPDAWMLLRRSPRVFRELGVHGEGEPSVQAAGLRPVIAIDAHANGRVIHCNAREVLVWPTRSRVLCGGPMI